MNRRRISSPCIWKEICSAFSVLQCVTMCCSVLHEPVLVSVFAFLTPFCCGHPFNQFSILMFTQTLMYRRQTSFPCMRKTKRCAFTARPMSFRICAKKSTPDSGGQCVFMSVSTLVCACKHVCVSVLPSNSRSSSHPLSLFFFLFLSLFVSASKSVLKRGCVWGRH